MQEKAVQQAKELAEADTAQQARDLKVKKRLAHLENIDEIIDEIDSLLEDQDVLTTFRQRGGE